MDKKHKEYENVKKILNYAKTHREHFVTTFIVANELDDMDDKLLDIVLPEYYASLSNVIESTIFNKYVDVKKLAWRYIQRLGMVDAKKVYKDALNYAWACHAKVDVFITLNRRGLLSNEFQSTIKRVNREMQVKYVRIMTPTEFLKFLLYRTL